MEKTVEEGYNKLYERCTSVMHGRHCKWSVQVGKNMKNSVKVAALQIRTAREKEKNLQKAAEMIMREDVRSADLVVLPEMFLCPYDTACFPAYAEEEGGDAWRRCAEMAKDAGVYLLAGSMPERDDAGNYYNTAYFFDPKGRQIAKHRKVHLFDIDIEGGQHFQESEVLSAGDEITVAETEFGGIGLCICYDIRFPELFQQMSDRGVRMILIPASFNQTTGPAHWELLFRGRAVDYQAYLVGVSSALDPSASYHSWGHSIITNPWGEVVMQMDTQEQVTVTTLDLAMVEKVREELPVLTHRRRELYEVQQLQQRKP